MPDNANEDHALSAGSVPGDVPPVRLVRWTRYPLIALAIVAIGPSILTHFVYIGLRLSGIHELEGYKIEFNQGTVAFMVLFPIVSAVANVSFLGLSRISAWRAQKEWPHLRSVRSAMWASLIAMCVPNTLFFIGTPEEMIVQAPDAGQGSGFGTVGLFLVQPIFGVAGWFTGRLLARARRTKAP